ncbi:hypothetical protein SPHS6_00400 [Sphingobium sp. S6]|nr:hypothetical protein SPHS8_00400 [Sphingobium sp. S8]CAD7335244.1 hypothetical protein SPHS6_00400 [Sphingobium sp. S6]CAD7335323.1 hypothetical protein SPHS8_00449 [Sphingobium sp. S8]
MLKRRSMPIGKIPGMADGTKIEWTDATVNAINGCSVVSPGCTNCYAMRLAGTRMKNHPTRLGLTINSKAGPVWNGEVRLVEQALLQPLRWQKPRMIFWNAHGDMFHPAVSDDWIDRCFAVMAMTPQHTHQVLTKRADRMREYLNDRGIVRRICEAAYNIHRARPCFDDGPEFSRGNSRRFNAKMKEWWEHIGALTAWTVRGGCAAVQFDRQEPGADYPSRLAWPLPNVWLGVSIEDQQRADERIPHLIFTPAAVRWLSIEPMLGPIDLTSIRAPRESDEPDLDTDWRFDALEVGDYYWFDANGYSEGGDGPYRDNRIDWIVVGGESGPGARPMQVQWARSLRDQCANATCHGEDAAVPFFFKQWGDYLPCDQMQADGKIWTNGSNSALRAHKSFTGRYLDGVKHDGVPIASD